MALHFAVARSVYKPMKRGRRQTDKQRREHMETLALLARVVVLAATADVHRVFYVLSI